ncbi:MAG: cytochrome c biogenesis protein CcsA [Gemmatimonadota bacterium]
MTHLLPFLLYVCAFGLWVRCLLTGRRGRAVRVAMIVTVLAVASHAFALAAFWIRYDELPLVGPGPALSSLAFVGGLATVIIQGGREASRVALTLLPFILIVQGVALAIGIGPSPMVLDFQGTGFIVHVTFAFLGYQGLAVAFAAGVLYLVQHHELKEKRMGRFFEFIPRLEILDRLGRVGLWAGFGCLTVALAFGWWWTVENRGSLQMADPKVLWALLSWLVFVGILLVRLAPGRNDYRGALAAVVGFCVVIGSYVILRLTLGGSGLFL